VLRCGEVKAFSIEGSKQSKRCLAETHRLFQHRLEHGREAARRGIDDLQHLGHCGLALQRLFALGSAFGKLTPQIGYELFGIG
jgi:hypothetical protein